MEIRGELVRPIDFVAVGHLAVDLRNGERALGGAAAYGCLAAARLGRTTAMVTAVGEDFDLFEPLEGIEIHYHPSRESTTFRNEYRGSQRVQHILGRARPLTEEDLAALRSRLADEALVFYCPIAREVESPLVPFEPGGACGVAPQGFFRNWDDDGAIHACSWEGARTALAEATFISLSMSDAPRPKELAAELAPGDRVLALTEGRRGARVYTGGRCFHVPAWERPEIEPTGAGDVFAASFLVALGEGREPIAAAELAACAASFAVEAPGVAGVFQSRADVERRLADYRARHRPREIEP
jgi:hypothetical protein